MTSLPTRLEGAAAGSRELDYAMKEWLEGFDDYWSLRVAADWTTSIEAAVAMAKRVVPRGRVMVVRGHDDGSFLARLAIPRGPEVHHAKSNAAAPALALCAATIRAHAEQVQG